ncbi:MAG: PKD domain-containing protein [Desulfobacterales bacterium]|jgi:PKD repeat protein
MKYLSRRYFKFILVYVGIIFAISLVHWDGAGAFFKSSLAEAANPGSGIPLDNPGIKKAKEVQDRHVEQLMRIPGVMGVGTGINKNGRPVIRVFTIRAGISNIPQKLEEIPVETKVTGMFVAQSDSPYWFPRPVPIGVSTGHPDITAGTLGARVIDENGNVYALSNNHVYANSNNARIGDYALQPGPYDRGIDLDNAIGTLFDYEPIDFSFFGANTMDAAIVLTTSGEVGTATPKDSDGIDMGYGTPNSIIWGDSDSDGVFDNMNDLLGLPVKKFGRTTGLTKGEITTINVTSNVCYANCSSIWTAYLARFVDQIVIERVLNGDAFSGGGDSGSLIVTDDENNNPVGLLFAGSDTTTLANRIDLVLERFDVSVDDGSSDGNIPPAADFSFTTSDLTVTFTDESNDVDGTIVSHNWVFGDGNTSTEQDPIHTYAADGTYTVTLTVTDDAGGTDSITQSVTVDDAMNAIPTADFTYEATGLTVDFTDESNDVDGTIASWNWVFGDGNTSTAQNPTHTYAADGTYAVTLTVTDNDGETDSTSQDVTVSDGSVATITLTATGKQNKRWFIVNLDWSGANSDNVEILKNDVSIITTNNDGTYTDKMPNGGGGSYTYQVCEEGTSTCSNEATVTFY